MYSYLKFRKQSVRINNKYSSFLELIAVVPQASILGFRFYLTFLRMTYSYSSLHNYTYDNTLAYSSNLNSLTDVFIEESQTNHKLA